MPLARFEPAIPASERPQTHALDCAATGIGIILILILIIIIIIQLLFVNLLSKQPNDP